MGRLGCVRLVNQRYVTDRTVDSLLHGFAWIRAVREAVGKSGKLTSDCGHKDPEIAAVYADLQKRFSAIPGVRGVKVSRIPPRFAVVSLVKHLAFWPFAALSHSSHSALATH